jgi:uncharacterized FlgJ-related protein
MIRSSQKRGSGRRTLVPFAVGLLILLLLFLRKTSSSQTIKNRLTRAGYTPDVASWWVAVSKMETADFTSLLAKKFNNLFGMGVGPADSTASGVTVRPSDGQKFATYATKADSVDDLILYMKRLGYPKNFDSVDSMVTFMKSKNYFVEDAAVYLKAVKSWL